MPTTTKHGLTIAYDVTERVDGDQHTGEWHATNARIVDVADPVAFADFLKYEGIEDLGVLPAKGGEVPRAILDYYDGADWILGAAREDYGVTV